MNKTLIYIALAAGVFCIIWKQMQSQQLQLAAVNAANNPAGGAQQATPGDLFQQGLTLLSGIFGAVQQHAQQAPKTV